MFSKDKNRDLTSEIMEQEYKVNIEETSINFGCVKKEFDEEELEFEEKEYKVNLNFENMFGESSIEQRSNRDNLIGFLEDDVLMETGSVKLEDVKEENKGFIQKTIEQSHCNKCSGNYQGYCVNCSSLSHVLNNVTPNLNPEPVLNPIPINLLEIREVSGRRAVFALKTLPKGIILGPFEGISPIESTTGLQWKMKDRKFVNDQNGNWMKYIESVANHTSKNLDVVQFDGILYFETNREIQEGEELLVCYGVEEEVLKSDKGEEFYLVPVKKEEYPTVFACTFCCLGFRLESCLVEHKSKCPLDNHGCNIEDFEIIQCRCCKLWIEKQEHSDRHMLHCLENYKRFCHNKPDLHRKPAGEIEETQGNSEISTAIDENRSYLTQKEVIHSKYSDGIGNKERYFSEKKHKCPECFYQTNRKYSFKLHLKRHNKIKPFECDICKNSFIREIYLEQHIRNHHSNTSEKEFKCSDCSYQTNYKSNFKRHFNIHMDIKPFECKICKNRFTQKLLLKLHVQNKHSNTHNDIKPFVCEICKSRFGNNNNLRTHIKDKHSNTSEKAYECSVCSYQTNRKYSLKLHLNTHNDIKPFECDICKNTFIREIYLKQHIKNKHSNTTEKEYKCSECSYQTNYKSHFKLHVNTHNGIKAFECDICKKRFAQKRYLKLHTKCKHSSISNTS